jgi:hypothetical protein
MKITLPSFLLLFILTTAINAQQKIGFKIILDQGGKTPLIDTLGDETKDTISTRWNSKSYGLSYEKVLSNNLLLSLETGLYLNFKNSKNIDTNSYNAYFSDNAFHNYSSARKIRELHIPILLKKYFYIKSAIFFVSAGPKLALTLSDKSSRKDTDDKSILSKDNNYDSDLYIHPSRFYLYNTLQVNLGIEFKKVQISFSAITKNPKRTTRFNQQDSYNNIKSYDWRNNDYSFTFSIGYML